LSDEAQRISGKVNGVVNGIRVDDVDLHAYVVTNDGRTYTAVSRIPSTIGYSLQSLYAVGSILGFLFALPQQPMLYNGFMLTGVYTSQCGFWHRMSGKSNCNLYTVSRATSQMFHLVIGGIL